MTMPPMLQNSLALPVIGGPMFTVSTHDLVIAQCKAGVIGSFPALNARPPEKLDECLTTIERDLAAYNATHPDRPSAPFAVNQDGKRTLDMLRWGLVPWWAKDLKVSFSNINAKAETVAEKPAFREAFKERRCIIPADGFYK